VRRPRYSGGLRAPPAGAPDLLLTYLRLVTTKQWGRRYRFNGTRRGGLSMRQHSDGHIRAGYHTSLGAMYQATIETFLASKTAEGIRGQVDLILTSPPFPLNRGKQYGNLRGESYLQWLVALAEPLAGLLTPQGSIVMEIGNSWEPGRPTMSTLPLRSLLAFLEAGSLLLCQQFVCQNPARLPTPAQWVNVERIRVKDSFTQVWWMSPSDRPKASNRQVLVPYSDAMTRLLARGTYNAGGRPSGHVIGERSFLVDNGGAIPSNVLSFANTSSKDAYRQYCREKHLAIHPARMAPGLVDFFVRMLTDQGDLVLDPFAGSNTTGAVAEALGRRWISVEPLQEYVLGSRGRFLQHSLFGPTTRAVEAE
jgi:hypothetical protein